ncbi:hypothetical protein ABZW11_25320 [Nonomuraea sp. NPDC004580]|uniref:hypothetical protein n=1 Tax=Nonomuraea sp. NPDC004580 TaxID=3154552 RepID=UPI0033BE6572
MDVVYSPYDPAVNDEPYPVYARMRAEAPLHHNPGLGFWALSRHADASAAPIDSELSTRAASAGPRTAT